MKKLTIIALLLWVAGQATAQNEADVQRYINNLPPGTARFGAMGGAFTALGGDMSSMHINPAGIGVFRFSEIGFTPSIETKRLSTSLVGTSTSGVENGFNIANAGFVLASELDDPFWRTVNVGFSINRMNSFNDELIVQGTVPLERSMMQSFVNEATGFFPDELSLFGAGLAFDAFVIDPVDENDPDNTQYVGRVTEGEMNQRQVARTSGRVNDFALTIGANYDDKLYVGGGLGFVSSFYQSTVETSESPTLGALTDLQRYRFTENLQVEGFGVNFRAGFIYRTESGLRVGGSIQTPTTFRMQDVYNVRMSSNLIGNDVLTSGDDFLEYRIRTPWRYTVGLAGVVNGKFIVSGQYEYVNFRGGQMLPGNRRVSGNPWSDVNNIIRDEFRAQHTVRAGVEFRMTKNWMARGGAAYFPNVIPANREVVSSSLDRIQLGGGIGYRKAAWNLDLSYTYASFNEPFRASSAGFVQEIRNTIGIVSLTLGFRL